MEDIDQMLEHALSIISERAGTDATGQDRTEALAELAARSMTTYARHLGVSTSYLLNQLGAAFASDLINRARQARAAAMELVTAHADGSPELRALTRGSLEVPGVEGALELVARWALVTCAADGGAAPADFVLEVLSA